MLKSYEDKYIKYKIKYKKLKSEILEKHNLTTYDKIKQFHQMEMEIIEHMITYFKMYNTISWDIGKFYTLPEINEALKTFCKDIEEELEKCNPPYDKKDITNPTQNDCCKYINSKKDTINISKNSTNKFNIRSIVNYDEFKFTFVESIPQILAHNYKKSLYSWIRQKCIEKIPNDLIVTPTDGLYEILDNDSYETLNKQQIVEILYDNFLNFDDLIEKLNPNFEKELEYIRLKKLSEQKLQIQSIQENDNKIFLETLSDDKKIYHLYFSYGNLKHLEYVEWEYELDNIIYKIQKMIKDDSVKTIVLGGHSVGSIVIQHLAVKLVKNKIDISKIFIIGSGCFIQESLKSDELQLFKSSYVNKYCFLISSYIDENNIIHYEHNDYMGGRHLNRIITYMLISKKPNFSQMIKIDEDTYREIIKGGKFNPIENKELHTFKTYSSIFLNQEEFEL